MSYNPRITPLTINVGPAASYSEPGSQQQPLQVPQVPLFTQVRQPQPQYCQQFVAERRNNCNKSCLVTIVLIVCLVIVFLAILGAYFYGAFDHQDHHGHYDKHGDKLSKHKCPQSHLMENGKCNAEIKLDWRCQHDHQDCEHARKLGDGICLEVTQTTCCNETDIQKFCNCYGTRTSFMAGYTISYLENLLQETKYSNCEGKKESTTYKTTTWCYWWNCHDSTKTWPSTVIDYFTATTISSSTPAPTRVTKEDSTNPDHRSTTTDTSTTTTSEDISDPTTTNSECPTYCSKIFDPVCGTDMVTYSNLCSLQKAKCDQNLEDLEVDHPGACPGSTTTFSTTPATATITECPQICMSIYQPVCGTDSQTYSSPCVLEVKQCNENPGLQIAYDGECIETTTPYKYHAWIGDGECDDITNTAEHHFDGGDCCKANPIKGSCLDCKCKETVTETTTGSATESTSGTETTTESATESTTGTETTTESESTTDLESSWHPWLSTTPSAPTETLTESAIETTTTTTTIKFATETLIATAGTTTDSTTESSTGSLTGTGWTTTESTIETTTESGTHFTTESTTDSSTETVWTIWKLSTTDSTMETTTESTPFPF